jgi:hypothetical protein
LVSDIEYRLRVLRKIFGAQKGGKQLEGGGICIRGSFMIFFYSSLYIVRMIIISRRI